MKVTNLTGTPASVFLIGSDENHPVPTEPFGCALVNAERACVGFPPRAEWVLNQDVRDLHLLGLNAETIHDDADRQIGRARLDSHVTTMWYHDGELGPFSPEKIAQYLARTVGGEEVFVVLINSGDEWASELKLQIAAACAPA